MAQREPLRDRNFPDEVSRDRYRDELRGEGRRGADHPGRRRGYEGWRRGRISGGFGSQFDAWSSGAGYPPGELRRGERHPGDWQPTRPARGPGAWAGDWERADYRGRGPKNHRRSDERVTDEICEALTDDWAVDAHEIDVTVRDGEVTLTGRVPSRQQKRRASECAERVPGVHDVFNQLRVAGPPDEAELANPRSGRR
jgi:hypothetical protein